MYAYEAAAGMPDWSETETWSGFWSDRAQVVGDAAREHAPAHMVPMPGGRWRIWVLHRYADIRNLAMDVSLGSTDYDRVVAALTAKLVAAGLKPDLFGLVAPTFLFRDPPAHTWLRALVAAWFKASRLDRQLIISLAMELAERLIGRHSFDLVREFAAPLPIMVISRILGVPESRQADFKQWTNGMMTGDQQTSVRASEELWGYLAELVQHRQTQRQNLRGDDLISALVTSGRLTFEEIVHTALLILVAGHETTVNLIGNAIVALLSNGDAWTDVVRDPSLVAAALWETGRWDAPLGSLAFRVLQRPYDLGHGLVLSEGETVLCRILAGNRDPRVYHDPTGFDLRRSLTRQPQPLTWGVGIHHCLGRMLGTWEGEAALTALTRLLPHVRLADQAGLRRRESFVTNGYETVDLISTSRSVL